MNTTGKLTETTTALALNKHCYSTAYPSYELQLLQPHSITNLLTALAQKQPQHSLTKLLQTLHCSHHTLIIALFSYMQLHHCSSEYTMHGHCTLSQQQPFTALHSLCSHCKLLQHTACTNCSRIKTSQPYTLSLPASNCYSKLATAHAPCSTAEPLQHTTCYALHTLNTLAQ